MSIVRRGRSVAAIGFLIAGGLGVISSTQTWLLVERADAGEPLPVSGADAMPLLAPLTLAVLALGGAIAIAGPVLRYAFAVLAVAAGVVLLQGTLPLLSEPPLSTVAGVVAEATGLSGDQALHQIVRDVAPSSWPPIALACWIILFATAAFVLVTARRWKAGGRRYQTAGGEHARASGPLDPIDSWDELSHGTDPTDSPR